MTHVIKHPVTRSHADTAQMFLSMANSIPKDKATDEQKRAKAHLRELASFHIDQSRYFHTYVTKRKR